MESIGKFATASPARWRKDYRRGVAALHVALLILCAVWSGFAFGQSNDDDGSWQKFVDSVGEAVYKFAWPTATYERVNFQGVAKTSDGVEVKIRAHGISAFDNGPLWTDVILQVRNGKIDDIRWGENNAILAAPGQTMKALGSLLVELNKEYNQNHPATAPDAAPEPSPTPSPKPSPSPAAVCLSNPTAQTLAYTLRIEGRSENHTLAPGKEELTWASVVVPEFTVSFDDSFADGYTDKTMRLPATAVAAEPTTCTDDMTYEFVLDGNRIGLSPRKWLPGFEHPFTPNLLRAQKEGDWACAQGQKWASSDPKILECVPSDVGLLGITINLENGAHYPKIIEVAPGGAAEHAGVPSGVYLLSVDGMSLDGLGLGDAVSRLHGPVGSIARIAIAGVSDDQPRVIEVQRQ